jgi:hypothetical protein
MKMRFHFSRLEMALLITNTLAFGGCLVLLTLGRGSGPLVFLTIGTFGMLVGKLGRAYYNARESKSALSSTEGR